MVIPDKPKFAAVKPLNVDSADRAQMAELARRATSSAMPISSAVLRGEPVSGSEADLVMLTKLTDVAPPSHVNKKLWSILRAEVYARYWTVRLFRNELAEIFEPRFQALNETYRSIAQFESAWHEKASSDPALKDLVETKQFGLLQTWGKIRIGNDVGRWATRPRWFDCLDEVDLTEALSSSLVAERITRDAMGSQRPEVGVILAGRGRILYMLGKLNESIQAYVEADEILSATMSTGTLMQFGPGYKESADPSQ